MTARRQPRPGTPVPELSIVIADAGGPRPCAALHALSRQSVPRDRYELIWVQQQPAAELEAGEPEPSAQIPADWCIVLPGRADGIAALHPLYNAGVLASRGRLVSILDRDARPQRTFAESVIESLPPGTRCVLHHDASGPEWTGRLACELRDAVAGCADAVGPSAGPVAALGPGCGLSVSAEREALIAIGGADEHADYAGCAGGPYELAARLHRLGLEELWHPTEHIASADPERVRAISATALETRRTGRLLPLVENAAVRRLRQGDALSLDAALALISHGAGGRAGTEDGEDAPAPHSCASLGEHRGMRLHDLKALGCVALPCWFGRWSPEWLEHPVALRGLDAAQVRAQIDAAGVPVRAEPLCIGTTARTHVVHLGTRFFGVPRELGPVDLRDPALLRSGRVRIGASAAEVAREPLAGEVHRPEGERAEAVPDAATPERLGEWVLYRHGDLEYGVPAQLGALDLADPRHRELPGVLAAPDRESLRTRVAGLRRARPVEYAGWLPAFRRFGNCGEHPQFDHTAAPPTGYRFELSDPRPHALRRVAGGKHEGRRHFLGRAVRNGVRAGLCAAGMLARALPGPRLTLHTLRFLATRHWPSLLALPARTELEFVPSIPQTLGERDWMIEIEDSTTLFLPFVRNGQTVGVDVRRSTPFLAVRALLESERCRGIVTHMRSTAESLPVLFERPALREKVSYVPLGLRAPAPVHRTERSPRRVELLFTSSWHQHETGFFMRGGLDTLAAFAALHPRHPELRLTLRCPLPGPVRERVRALREAGADVRVIEGFLPRELWIRLLREADLLLLPAARIHVHSVIEAKAHGVVPIVSDGWGMEEYVQDGIDGVVVSGRAGVVSWMEPETGVLREDFRPMWRENPAFVEQLTKRISALVEDPHSLTALRRRARRSALERHSLEAWNAGLARALDRAFGERP